MLPVGPLDTPCALATAPVPGAELGGYRGLFLQGGDRGDLPALWLPAGSSTRLGVDWPLPSLISIVNVVFILPPGSAVPTATGSRVLGSSEQAPAPPAPFSRDLAAKPRPRGPSSRGQL